jgi:hypothetical protein
MFDEIQRQRNPIADENCAMVHERTLRTSDVDRESPKISIQLNDLIAIKLDCIEHLKCRSSRLVPRGVWVSLALST